MILSAICLSVIASLGAYKIGEARKVLNEERRKTGAVYVDFKPTDPSNALLQAALENIESDETASGTDDNPFTPKPTDTMTDSFAKSIFLTYAERESGQRSDDDASIANSVIGQIDVSNLPKVAYSLNNVQLFVPMTNDEVKKYGNDAGTVIKNNYLLLGTPEYADNDLRKVARLHKQIGQALIQIKVPAALAQSHLNLANAYVMFGDSLDVLATQEKVDPLRALLSIRTAEESSKNLTKAAGEINSYFEQNDILYSDNEAGLIWPRLTVAEQ